MDKSSSHYVLINRLHLHYLEWGEHHSQPMILLHGTGDNAHMWDHFASTMCNRFRIIALDQRGHGNSDWTIPPAYSCRDYVSDLTRFIKSLQLKRVILMGHSMGALHATKYTSLVPDKVLALIHVDIEACPPLWNKEYLHKLFVKLPAFYNSTEDFVDHLHITSPYAKKEMLRYLAFHALKRKQNGKLELKFDKEVLNHFDDYDLGRNLADIKCPTLIIRGEESRVMRRKTAHQMNSSIPNSRLVEIPKSTHPVHSDNPAKFQEVVSNFLIDIHLIET